MDLEGPSYRVLSIAEEEPVPLNRGATHWLPLRRRLGIQAFGTNLYRAPLKGGAVIEEHVESTGQQEMYIVISGRVRFALGEDELEAPEGTVVFVLEPDLRRSAKALEDDSAVLAVGGWTDQSYHSLPWEPIYLAQDSMRQGDWAAAAATLESEAGEHGENAFVQFRLACCHAQLGEHETALEELRRAIELSPGMRERATSEEHLAPLRGLEGWSAAIG